MSSTVLLRAVAAMTEAALLALRDEIEALHAVLAAKDDTISALRSQVAVLRAQLAGGAPSRAARIPAREAVYSAGVFDRKRAERQEAAA